MPDAMDASQESWGPTGLLWVGVLAPAVLWFAHMQVTYTLAPWTCKHDMQWLLHVETAVFLVLAVLPLLWCWRAWARAGYGTAQAGEAPPLGRTRFIALLGITSCVYFGMVIVAQGLVSFFIGACSY